MVNSLFSPHLEHIKLIGNEEENYFQLGIKHREKEKNSENRSFANTILKKTLGLATQIYNPYSNHYCKLMKAYAEGKKLPFEQVLSSQLCLEVPKLELAGLHFNQQHFLNGMSLIVPRKTKENLSAHVFRILEYHGAGPQFIETHQSQLSTGLSYFSICDIKYPFPISTIYTKSGLTVMCQKLASREYHPNGQTIHDICYNIIQNCQSSQQVIELLSSSSSLSAWSITVIDKDGLLLEIKIDGDKIKIEESELSHITSRVIQTAPSHDVSFQSKQLEQFLKIEKKIKTVKKLDSSLLKLVKSPLNDSDNYCVIGPHTKLLVGLDTRSGELVLNSPLIHGFSGRYEKFDAAITDKVKSIKVEDKEKSIKAMQHYYQALELSDYDKERAYHCIQLAIKYLDDGPYKTQALFFFILWQIQSINNKNELSLLYQELKLLSRELPSKLRHHSQVIFILLEKILSLSPNEEIDSDASDEIIAAVSKIKRTPNSFLSFFKSRIKTNAKELEVVYPVSY